MNMRFVMMLWYAWIVIGILLMVFFVVYVARAELAGGELPDRVVPCYDRYGNMIEGGSCVKEATPANTRAFESALFAVLFFGFLYFILPVIIFGMIREARGR